jgi:DNA-binding GntR family transcriptional regulator
LAKHGSGPLTLRPATSDEDVAYEQLRASIIAGRLLPNERLVEGNLAETFGVGRASIRPAIARLAQEQLVERLPNRGARVRRISDKESVEIIEARMVLECLAARYAAQHATAADVKRLRAILATMEALHAGGDIIKYMSENDRFHREVTIISRHDTVAQLVETLQSRGTRFQDHVLTPEDPEVRQRQHASIADAIEAHDEDGAESAMREHLSDLVLFLRRRMRGPLLSK